MTGSFGRFQARLRALGCRNYSAYLKSDHWLEFRKKYAESRLPQHCLACENPRFQLHHRSYERVGEELLADVIPLCGECHVKVHEYAKSHGKPINVTHYIMRKVFGWTKGQTRKRFSPFCAPGTKYGYRWVPRDIEEARRIRDRQFYGRRSKAV